MCGVFSLCAGDTFGGGAAEPRRIFANGEAATE